MKRLLIAAGLAAALAIPAAAQTTGELLERGQFSFRVGAFIPVEEALRTPADVWFSLGLDFEIDRGLIPGATTVFSVDWFTFNGGANSNIFPIIVSQRWYGAGVEQRTYFHVGIGAAITDFMVSDTVFATRGGVGMEFNDRFFGEANFTWTDEPSGGTNSSGFAVYGGIRF